MRTACRMCKSSQHRLTPVGYCYLCLSRFGSSTQVAMLLLAYNPYLSVDELDRALGLHDREFADYLWKQVRLRLDEEWQLGKETRA